MVPQQRQLRDVAICPHDEGIVSYARNFAIVEQDLATPHISPRRLVDLTFTPNTISALNLPDSNDTLLAAGGQEAELHLSYYQASEASSSRSTRSGRPPKRRFGTRLWESKYILDHGSINNSVMLTSMNFARSHQSAAEPRIVVSNNDRTVKFFDIAIRNTKGVDDYEPRLLDIGQLSLDVPVNHSSISPDGRTLLCVGDSPDVYLWRVAGGSRISLAPIATLSLSPHIQHSHQISGGLSQISSIPASFSTSFSADGSKFAVASQEGVVVVWDVRSTKPLKVFGTDKSHSSLPGRIATGAASGWMYDAPWDWARGGTRAPGWGVRSVKFSPPGVGREVMTFTEHTSLLHVVDARTFETEEIVRMPSFEPTSMYHHSTTASARQRSTSPTLRSSLPRSSASSDSLVPPRIVLFSGALEDTFRIPASDSASSSTTWRASRRTRRHTSRDDLSADDDPDSIVVIPPLGDREVENDVRRLLGRHGVRAHTTVLDSDSDPREPLDGSADRERDGDEMDVDELESDCLSSHAPSRAGSPVPASQQSQQSAGARPLELLRSRPTLLARRESSGPYAASRWSSSSGSRRHRRVPGAAREQAREEPEEEQDLAGMCFDPKGRYVYVASVKGVAEWEVRGAEQRWWTEPEWA
ncbi:hypothetical protein C8Q80DRAFT_636078 [Daedaleopsis nitida]|nr:hypothetical protein C8Q80DRAFT_636078 [Daedaleopsis nitida]